MLLNRNWVTPLAAGAFLLSAVTGVLIFFHQDSGLNKAAHEWLSWVLLAGVGLHVGAHLAGFRRHLSSRRGRGVMGLFALLLALSFLAPADKGEPPFMASIRALSETPLSTLAVVAQRSPEELRGLLAAEGLPASSDRQTLAELAGPDMKKRMHLLKKLLAGQADRKPG